MGEARVITNETLVIDVVKKKSSAFKWIGKIIAFVIGGIGLIFSSLLFLTIIGIPIAVGFFFMSLTIFMMGFGKQKVECPHCKKKNFVLQTVENFTCSKCKNLSIINWI